MQHSVFGLNVLLQVPTQLDGQCAVVATVRVEQEKSTVQGVQNVHDEWLCWG